MMTTSLAEHYGSTVIYLPHLVIHLQLRLVESPQNPNFWSMNEHFQAKY